MQAGIQEKAVFVQLGAKPDVHSAAMRLPAILGLLVLLTGALAGCFACVHDAAWTPVHAAASLPAAAVRRRGRDWRRVAGGVRTGAAVMAMHAELSTRPRPEEDEVGLMDDREGS